MHPRPDAMPAESGLKRCRCRHHEAQPRRGIGKLALQIEKVRAGDVPLLKAAATGDHTIRLVTLGRRRLEIGRTIIDPELGLAETGGQLFGAREGPGIAHVFYPHGGWRRAPAAQRISPGPTWHSRSAFASAR